MKLNVSLVNLFCNLYVEFQDLLLYFSVTSMIRTFGSLLESRGIPTGIKLRSHLSHTQYVLLT